MKVLALYKEDTLSLHRRVKAPFSALSKQGHSFSFLQVESFSAGIGFSSDVTVLQDWLLSEEELAELGRVALTRLFVVDCSDPLLLQQERYRRQLQIAHLVTVPNGWMKREISLLNHNIAVLPSTMDKEHFFGVRKTVKFPENYPTTIGCFGPYDWYLVRDALLEIKTRYPRLYILGGKEAFDVLGDIIAPLPFGPLAIPEVIYQTAFGLCPYDGDHGWDEIWQREYGILCRPTITLRPPRSSKSEEWVDAIKHYLLHPEARAMASNFAYKQANMERSTKVACLYSDAYRKKLPHLSRA